MKILRLLIAANRRARRSVSTFCGTALFRLELLLNGVKYGRHICSCGFVDLSVHPTSRVSIGDYLKINACFLGNPVGGYRRTQIFVGPGASLEIGHNVGMSNCTIVCWKKIHIGDNVLIGGDVKIYDTDFHSLNAYERRTSINCHQTSAPVMIGNNAFIGAHSVILKGSKIGDNTIIGAGTVVSKIIPANEIWAGSAARHIQICK
jgi:acetyltransferase-like isoleucine patch superfamily enzyme